MDRGMTRIAINATLATGAIIATKVDILGFVDTEEFMGLEPMPLFGDEGLLGGESELPDDGLLPGEGTGLAGLPPLNKGLPEMTTFTVPLNFGNGGEMLLALRSSVFKDVKLVQLSGM
jgi:hypothetical protein